MGIASSKKLDDYRDYLNEKFARLDEHLKGRPLTESYCLHEAFTERQQTINPLAIESICKRLITELREVQRFAVDAGKAERQMIKVAKSYTELNEDHAECVTRIQEISKKYE